jgi:hypothetical protein
MAKFNRLLDADFQPPRTWILDLSLSFDSDVLSEAEATDLKAVGVKINAKNRITVPKGFKTDLASVPRVCWVLVAPFDVARPGVVHDYIYWCIRQYRGKLGESQDVELVRRAKKAGDKVFKDAMTLSVHVAGWKRWAAHKAVVLFGASSIVPREEL